ncbi:hypothetical protein RvY_05041 [Ramazzottius varieornatus]|uniref:Uncharacterized protein n=1 Tax=Ramazzottius varieornatus TaxID=947166 RepID=A0A1D1UTS3_RAMVA|nr:hypothetical protein RvY_05041 [Ramazzottius varieornatus]
MYGNPDKHRLPVSGKQHFQQCTYGPVRGTVRRLNDRGTRRTLLASERYLISGVADATRPQLSRKIIVWFISEEEMAFISTYKHNTARATQELINGTHCW